MISDLDGTLHIRCIAVTTPLTRPGIYALRLLDERWIVDDPATLPTIVRHMVTERKQDSKSL